MAQFVLPIFLSSKKRKEKGKLSVFIGAHLGRCYKFTTRTTWLLFFSSSSAVMRWKTKRITRRTSPNRAMFEMACQNTRNIRHRAFSALKNPAPERSTNVQIPYTVRAGHLIWNSVRQTIERYHIRTYTCARVHISRKIERNQQTLKINNSSSPSSWYVQPVAQHSNEVFFVYPQICLGDIVVVGAGAMTTPTSAPLRSEACCWINLYTVCLYIFLSLINDTRDGDWKSLLICLPGVVFFPSPILMATQL